MRLIVALPLIDYRYNENLECIASIKYFDVILDVASKSALIENRFDFEIA